MFVYKFLVDAFGNMYCDTFVWSMIIFGILSTVFLVITIIFREELFAFLFILSFGAGLLCFAYTPSHATMIDRSYARIMNERPTCLAANSTDAECLKQYGKWLHDSAFYRHVMDDYHNEMELKIKKYKSKERRND